MTDFLIAVLAGAFSFAVVVMVCLALYDIWNAPTIED